MDGMEEERRLAYVGITAPSSAFTWCTPSADLVRDNADQRTSRFIADVPSELATGRDPGTAFNPARSGAKMNSVPEKGLSEADILGGGVSIYGSGKSFARGGQGQGQGQGYGRGSVPTK